MFEPVAVVGRGCVLPEAPDPDVFWDNVAGGRRSIGDVPAGRWRLPASAVAGLVGPAPAPVRSATGGYVGDVVADAAARGVDPGGLLVGADTIAALDPSARWALYATAAALREAGDGVPPDRAGLVLGTLSMPTDGMVRYAEDVWFAGHPDLRNAPDGQRPVARDRFSSATPTHLTAAALGLGAGAFALDAACASSLYAIKLACDRLHDRTADLMVAGAVNRVDDLAVHLAFSALGALSPSGRSRPFHREADGLVPAEGSAVVALMRWEDARAADVRILGVIRGIGLSNDGRAAGLLVPSEEGQLRALHRAYSEAGVAPESVSLLECHATGTVVGDTTEVRSAATFFAGARDLPIGSVKSNTGHLVTAAGAAGLLKVLGAFEAGVRPPTLSAEEPVAALDGTPMRLLREAESWTGPRRAGISAFGFGGNNAHLVIDAGPPDSAAALVPPTRPEPEPVAIVAIGARVGDGGSYESFRESLLGGAGRVGPAERYDVSLDGLRTPPADLRDALGQQVAVLEAAREATRGTGLPRERTTVLIGMGCDAEVARHPTRVRVAAGAGALDDAIPDALAAPLGAPGVLGTMPNLVANRISSQLDLAGPGFTVSAEEASGLVALELGVRALRDGTADVALVGAVDLSCEPVHRRASAEVGCAGEPGDAAVVLVLKRAWAADRDGDPVLALIGGKEEAGAPELVVGDAPTGADTGPAAARFDPATVFGVPHAAKGLLAVACAAVALRHGAVPRPGAGADPALGIRRARVAVEVLGARPAGVTLTAAEVEPWVPEAAVRSYVFSGAGAGEAIAAARAGREGDHGPARLVVLAGDSGQLAARTEAAARWLDGRGVRPEGVAFRARPVGGELAAVHTNGSASYPRMGRETLLAFPDVLGTLERRCGPLRDVAGWAYTGTGDDAPHVLDRIWGAALLGQLHAEIGRDVLGLRPTAVLGYSSGETTALVATGAWRDVPQLVEDTRRSPLFTHEVAGDLAAVHRAWRAHGVRGGRWAAHLVSAGAGAVRDAIADEPTAHLMAVSAPGLCVLGGEATACARVIARLGAHAVALDYDIAVHIPEVERVREPWRALHDRPTIEVPDVRFYSCASHDSYTVSRSTAADAITEQAVGTIDFVATVEQAWRDGVRVFVEHGPRGLCTGWIDAILGDREHLAVALDSADGGGIRSLTRAVAGLRAAGVPVRDGALFDRLAPPPAPRRPRATVALPAHPAPVVLPDTTPAERMAPAPELPPVPAEPVPPPVPAEPGHRTAPQPAPPAGAGVAPRPGPEGPAHGFAATARIHRQFLDEQGEVHRRYLAVASRAQEVLLRHSRGVSAPPSGPVPHTSPSPAPPVAPGSPGATDRPQPAAPRRFGRAELEVLAAGRVADVLGPAFAEQDGFRRQVRMPMPPMLLADRVTGIDAEQGRLGTGTIRTETDVEPGSWYLDPAGRMPTGLMIEAGQADLLLISWMGVDLLNRGERVYRLLGCEVTFHGPPPVPGETLAFDIHIDGHGEQGGTRLFFFHYDCRVDGELRFSVRAGQAGFFTDAELAGSGGVLWDPAADAPDPAAPAAPPALATEARSFSAAQVVAFSDGRPDLCFGPAWPGTRAHVRTPRIADGRMLRLGEITDFSPDGGPWGRGHLRARTAVSPDDWYFAGHFKDDPCMPGTLMFEGCLQAMAFWLAASGHTADADGWRFEPVTGVTLPMRCRGQVTPQSREIVYEVVVAEVSTTPVPTVIADVLCTVDGLPAFHVRRAGLRLVPDWPLAARPPAERTGSDPRAAVAGGVRFDAVALLASARGRPSDAFGAGYRVFDGVRRAPRLPGPPFLFVSRIVSVDSPPATMWAGAQVVAEYDVDPRAWYWDDAGVLPASVLMEVALQPCGWLASYTGCALSSDDDLVFRNLDGAATVLSEVTPATGAIRTTARLRDVSTHGGTIIVSFDLRCEADGVPLVDASSVFGFFPRAAVADRTGLRVTDEERAGLVAGGTPAEPAPAEPDPGAAGLPGSALWDRVRLLEPHGGPAGLGRALAEKRITGGEWYFRAHFFQDPVQPGSFGVEAMIGLLQLLVLRKGYGAAMRTPRFEPVAVGAPLRWRYRGQVTPDDDVVTIELNLTRVDRDRRGVFVQADAWLWVDGVRIYEVLDLPVRLVDADADATRGHVDTVLDPATDDWLGDHRPNWTAAVLPMMSVVDLMFAAARSGGPDGVRALRDLRIRRWITVEGPTTVRTAVSANRDGDLAVTTSVDEGTTGGGPGPVAEVADAILSTRHSAERPSAWPDPSDATPLPDPYETGMLSHGPRFRHLTSLRVGAAGSVATLDAAGGGVPRGELHQGLLDACTHVVPHAELWRWSAAIGWDRVGYPSRITTLDLYEPLPDRGLLVVRARFAGFEDGAPAHPSFDVQVCHDDRVLVTFHLVDVLVGAGPLAALDHTDRRAFLRDRRPVDGVGLSRRTAGATRSTRAGVVSLDWLPGTVATVYALPAGGSTEDRLSLVAAKDHLAYRLGLHPADVEVDLDTSVARAGGAEYPFVVHVAEGAAEVRDAQVPLPVEDRP
ncbi:beta-ketoacyl synthase N-terminal-like domain-containing protein [Pseudonocardia sp. ICBG1293]|uniref:beta-ketoacyl synthase N-terminal-like domain-containing protein n=1 Tax=Pseudonocardia sp. ICBG1293 TaxID=2844382 RepID=UPI001CCC5094|nr:beta-ketoacyl synthase N-terminal-like domain-containing protein [Pseudonocardia sp. ICBG1293]